jgi:hypothetical protein
MDLSIFLGVGLTDILYHEISPELPSRLWLELDVVPMVFSTSSKFPGTTERPQLQRVDDQADSMARKTVKFVCCIPL